MRGFKKSFLLTLILIIGVNCFGVNTGTIAPTTGVATNSYIALTNNNIVNALSYPTGTISPALGVATNSYIALFNNNVVNAINSFTSAPTFSNVTISGSLSVAGISQLSNSTTIGTGTVAANTSSLGILRVKHGSSWIDFGQYGSGTWGIWGNAATPTTTNYFAVGDNTGTAINDASANGLNLRTGGITRMFLGSSTASVLTGFYTAGTSTLTGAVNTSSINNAGYLYLQSYGNNTLRLSANDFVVSAATANMASSTPYLFNAPLSYSHTASTNVPAFKVTGGTRGFLAGAKSEQYENYFSAPTYTATGATTISTAYGLYVEKPIAGTNMSITGNWGIGTDGNINAGGSTYGMAGSTALDANSNRVRLAASSGFTAAEVTNGKPLVLDNVALRGGNTGTVAVLSDALFGLEFSTTGATSPADATTYYIATGQFFNWTTVAGATKMYLPYNCTLKGYTMNWYINGTAPSAESATLAINIDGVATDLNTSVQPTAGASNTFTNTSLNTNINAGSWIEGVIKTPTWVTNPGNSYVTITFWFVRRQ